MNKDFIPNDKFQAEIALKAAKQELEGLWEDLEKIDAKGCETIVASFEGVISNKIDILNEHLGLDDE